MYNNISSTSAFVNHYHTSYTIGNQVYFYDSENKKTLKTTDLKYKETFGKLPTVQFLIILLLKLISFLLQEL